MNHKSLSISLICLCVLLQIRCAESTGDVPIERKNTAPIATTISPTDSLMINAFEHVIVPFTLLNLDDTYLIVAHYNTERLLNVFSLPDLNYLYSWGSHGRGPTEYTDPPRYFNTPGGDTLILSDVVGFKQDTYVVNDSSLVLAASDQLSYTGQMGVLERVRQISDSMYIADYISFVKDDNYEYVLLKKNQPDYSVKFGEYPITDWPDMYQKQMYHLKSNAFNKDVGIFAAFYMSANAIKLFDTSGTLLNHIMYDDFDFSTVDRTAGRHQLLRYIQYSDEAYIYTIGFNRENASDGTADNESTFFEVWDWDGNSVYRASFDRKIDIITISQKNGLIYGYSSQNPDAIYLFQIPEEVLGE
jgi:hypothetical protein